MIESKKKKVNLSCLELNNVDLIRLIGLRGEGKEESQSISADLLLCMHALRRERQCPMERRNVLVGSSCL